MYICICKAVSDKRLQQAVNVGDVVSLRDLTRELGVGTGCGKCIPAARQALGEALSARNCGAIAVEVDSAASRNLQTLGVCPG